MKTVWITIAAVSMAALACTSSDDTEGFRVPPNAVKIGDSELYLPGGEQATLPPATTSATAPKIVGVSATKTGTYSFVVNIEVEGSSDIGWVFFDFGADGAYKAKPTALVANGSDEPITACGIAAEQQGITCTAACLAACSCITCADDAVERNIEQACALNCTLYDNNGSLAKEPYNGSEATFAHRLYHGSPEDGLPGMASQSGCDASACKDPNAGGSGSGSSARKKGWSVEFQTPTIPQATPLFAPQVATNDMADVSPPGGAASVRICEQGVMSCR